jgi:hypothetical protein
MSRFALQLVALKDYLGWPRGEMIFRNNLRNVTVPLSHFDFRGTCVKMADLSLMYASV